MSHTLKPPNSAKVWWFDLGVVVLITVLGTVGLVLLDAFERLQVIFEVHENSELDDLFLGAGLLALSLIWFLWRRWRNSASQSTANLLSEIKLREQAESTAKKSEARLRDAIENIPGGFVLRDADDRVVLFNERYREWNADVAHLLKPGVQFETMLRDAMHRRKIGTVEGEDWVNLRLAKSRETSEPFEEQHSNGLWLRIEERRTSDGGYVGVRTDITELKQSQTLLYDAIGTMAEGFALYDSDERMVMCNEPYRETLPRLAALGVLTPGMKMEDILRAGVKAGLVPPVYTSGEAYLTERLEKFRNPPGPFEFKTTHGQWIRTEEKKTLNGGTVAIRTDITERKQAEEALKASEGHLRSVIDNYPFLITLKDLDGRYILVNDAYAKSRNVSVEQAMGRFARDHETPNQTTIVEAHDREVIESRKTIEYERDTILSDGVRVTRAVTKFPTYDDEGELTGVGTISTDVTERKQAEKALRDSENLFKSIIDNVPSTILLKDQEGRLTLVNK
ncbi:MAG: PAS domain S-box protein, partial [Rhodospirillaceae bacterium]|nr:PAS domain S-box protein [Rhodospirillaceae bacterium]